MNVTIKDKKTGIEKTMAPRYAKVLVLSGRAEYMTRDMVAAPAAAPAPTPVSKTPTAQAGDDLIGDDLDTKTLEQLHEIAKAEGVKLHPQTKEEKSLAAIRAARAAK